MRLLRVMFLVALLATLLPHEALAQGSGWYVSAANFARYYHFKDSKEDSAATRFQFDSYMGDFYLGAWFESKHVMQEETFNTTYNAISQRYLGWENKGLTIHAGNFYEVYDRGLVLNTFRDDDVGIDLILDGLKVNWRSKYLDFDALSTTQDTTSIKPIVRATRLKLKLLDEFHIGGAYASFIDENRANITQANVRLGLQFITGYVEYARREFKTIDIMNPIETIGKTGDGTYANVTAAYSYFTGLFEYKNYQHLTYPESGPKLNLPPAVNRSDRLIQSESANYPSLRVTGERGYRGNLTTSWTPYWAFEVDYSKAYSRGAPAASLAETFFEIRGNYFESNTFYVDLGLLQFQGTDEFGEAHGRDETRSEFQINYALGGLYSVTVTPYMILYEPVDSSSYTHKFVDITFGRAPDIKLAVGGSLSDQESSQDPKRMAYVETTITLSNNDLIVFFGGQRGGLVCSSGVCFYRPTFEGLRVILISRF